MITFPLVRTVLREACCLTQSPRIPEPDLVMDNPEKVAAFKLAGSESGIMASVYLYHSSQISDVIKPGDTVLDLGCGPANQLSMVARLNPDAHFIGLDLSGQMLEQARDHIKRQGLQNVSFKKADITNLESFPNASVDALFSTVVLHHLPTTDHLFSTFSEIERVLKPGGGLYLVDFAHLKSEKSIEYFAYRGKHEQPELFTEDYLYSLRAAFSLSDFSMAYEKHLRSLASFYAFRLMPYMIAIKSPSRRENDSNLKTQLQKLKFELPKNRQIDLEDVKVMFRLSGLIAPYLI